MAKPTEQLDMVDQPTRVGDIVIALVPQGYRKASQLGIGRVSRLTGKAISVRLCHYNETTKKWGVSANERNIRPDKYFRVSMHSVPPEVFTLLDEIEIG